MSKRMKVDIRRTVVKDKHGRRWEGQNGRWRSSDGKTSTKRPPLANPFVDNMPDTEDDLFEEPEVDVGNDPENDT